MADALTMLEKWARKHYYYTIKTGGFIMPGGGVTVTLAAGGRQVCVADTELDVHDATGEVTHYGTLADTIVEALRQWHADTTPKRFRLLWADRDTPPEGLSGYGYRRTYADSTMWDAVGVFPTEAEALKAVADAYRAAGRPEPDPVHVWEIGPAPKSKEST